MESVTDVIESALALPLADRTYLATKLIESLENEELNPETIQEYNRRVDRWNAGESRALESDELDSKVRQILNR